jgi:hypothetical protein
MLYLNKYDYEWQQNKIDGISTVSFNYVNKAR